MTFHRPQNGGGHGLIEGLVYGPVSSRRYGMTLGINLLPAGHKMCNFNCVYCQLGWNDPQVGQPSWPKPIEIKTALTDLLSALTPQQTARLDHLVISGNGEPTLHPQFLAIIKAIKEIQSARLPQVRLVCLTNGTMLHQNEVLEGMEMLDECAVKIDPDACRVNLPQVMPEPVQLASAAKRLKNLAVQSCFFDGRISNVSDEIVTDWICQIVTINPIRVDIYTLARETAATGLAPLTRQQLITIGNRLSLATSIPVRVVA